MRKLSIFTSIISLLIAIGMITTPHFCNEKTQTIISNISIGVILIIHVLLLVGYLLSATIENDMNYIEQQLSSEYGEENAFDEGIYVEKEKPQMGRRHKASRK